VNPIRGDCRASSAILRLLVDTLSGFRCIRRVSFRRPNDPTPRFPPRGPPVCGVPALHGGGFASPSVLSGRCDFPPPVPPRSVFLRSAVPSMRSRFRSRRLSERAAGGPGLVGVRPARAEVRIDGDDGISQVPGEPPLHLRRALRPRQDHRRLTGLRRHSAAPVAGTSRAPALRLSRLNPPALVLAVYASPRRSPAQDARLASGCWSGSAGRAFTRRVPTRGFRVFPYISSSSPKLAWRNPALRAPPRRLPEVVPAPQAQDQPAETALDKPAA